MSRFHSRRDSKLKELAQSKPFVAASLCKVKRRCGHPNCKCAKGQPHEAYLLCFKAEGNKSRSVHVPKDLVPEVQEWVDEYKRIKKLTKEVSYNSIQIVRHHVRTERAAAKTRRRSSR